MGPPLTRDKLAIYLMEQLRRRAALEALRPTNEQQRKRQ